MGIEPTTCALRECVQACHDSSRFTLRACSPSESQATNDPGPSEKLDDVGWYAPASVVESPASNAELPVPVRRRPPACCRGRRPRRRGRRPRGVGGRATGRTSAPRRRSTGPARRRAARPPRSPEASPGPRSRRCWHADLHSLIVLPDEPHGRSTDDPDNQEGPPGNAAQSGGRARTPELSVGQERGADGEAAQSVPDQQAESTDHTPTERRVRQKGRPQRLHPEYEPQEQRPERRRTLHQRVPPDGRLSGRPVDDCGHLGVDLFCCFDH